MTYITGLAVNHDDAPMVESFVMRGADIDGYDRDGNTALLRAGYSLKHACVHKRVHRSLSLHYDRPATHKSVRHGRGLTETDPITGLFHAQCHR